MVGDGEIARERERERERWTDGLEKKQEGVQAKKTEEERKERNTEA